jgi:hypothetical protein
MFFYYDRPCRIFYNDLPPVAPTLLGHHFSTSSELQARETGYPEFGSIECWQKTQDVGKKTLSVRASCELTILSGRCGPTNALQLARVESRTKLEATAGIATGIGPHGPLS